MLIHEITKNILYLHHDLIHKASLILWICYYYENKAFNVLDKILLRRRWMPWIPVVSTGQLAKMGSFSFETGINPAFASSVSVSSHSPSTHLLERTLTDWGVP